MPILVHSLSHLPAIGLFAGLAKSPGLGIRVSSRLLPAWRSTTLARGRVR